jgi:hypothetical protein
MFEKRGVSAIVATVLIIMISVAAVAILWQFIIPTVKESLEESTSEKVQLSIETEGGYTTWDEEQKIARVQVKRGNDNANLTGIDFTFFSEGNSVNEKKLEVPAKNEIKVYTFELAGKISKKPEKVTVAPITSSGVGAVVSESNVISNFTGTNPLCDYSEWSVCNSSGFRNKTKLQTSAIGCEGDSVVIESCIPSILIVTESTEPDFNKVYTYSSSNSRWVNGSYQIYKDTLWYLTNGTISYTATDNGLSVPPVLFSRTMDYPLKITVVGAGTTEANRVYSFSSFSSGGDFAWYLDYDPVIQKYYAIHNYLWNANWWLISGPYSSSASHFLYARYNEDYKSYPDKDGWQKATYGVEPFPTLDYSLEANATVSVVT